MDINYKKIHPLNNIEVMVTALVMGACLLLFLFIPTSGIYQQFFLSIVTLLLTPILYIKIVLKLNARDFGWNFPKWKEGFLIMPACFFIAAIFMGIIFRYTDFSQNYFLADTLVKKSVVYFLVYEFLMVNFFVFLYEVFFRGFVLFYFSRKVGVYAVFVQFFVFLIFFAMAEMLSLNYVFYILAAFLGGIIAYKSKSLVYSYFFSIIVLVVSDIIYLKLIK